MPGADGHGFDDRASLDRLVLFCIDEVQNVDQRRSFTYVRLRVSRRVVVPVVVVVVVVEIAALVLVVGFVYYALRPVSFPVPPRPPLLLRSALCVVLLLARVLVQEENRPVLIPYVGLIRQHELGQHVLVARDGDGVLVFHDGPTVDVEGGDEDVLDVHLGTAARVLRAQAAGAAHRSIIARLCAGRQRAVVRRGGGTGRRCLTLGAQVRAAVHVGGPPDGRLRRAGGGRGLQHVGALRRRYRRERISMMLMVVGARFGRVTGVAAAGASDGGEHGLPQRHHGGVCARLSLTLPSPRAVRYSTVEFLALRRPAPLTALCPRRRADQPRND